MKSVQGSQERLVEADEASLPSVDPKLKPQDRGRDKEAYRAFRGRALVVRTGERLDRRVRKTRRGVDLGSCKSAGNAVEKRGASGEDSPRRLRKTGTGAGDGSGEESGWERLRTVVVGTEGAGRKR